MAEKIVSKSEFARLINANPSRITEYIDKGKIGPDAIVGEGRTARIRVELAKAHLRVRLDSGQRLGNGLGTKLAPERAEPTRLPTSASIVGGTSSPFDGLDADEVGDDALDAEIKREKLVQLQRANRKGAEDEAAAQGRFTETLAARRQMGIVAVQTMRVFEGAVPEMATTIASRFAIEERDVLQVLSDLFRTIRAQAAEKARISAEVLPRLVPDGAEPESGT